MVRALLGWGLFSFAVLQVVEPILHAYRLPEWTLTLVVSLLAAGFPVTVALAWVFDLTGKGVTRTVPAAGDGGAGAGPSGSRFVPLLLGLGLVAAAPGLVYFFVWPGTGRAPAVPVVPSAPVPPGASAALAAPGAPSIAVLAFADLSPTKDQEYFSDGIAEEILNALARVKGLRVAGRTSSFHFKGRNEDLHAIGTTLGVANILEGSVRKQGNKVRITAQLIKASDGFHLWSKTYDGDLTDVFELQERIARAITDELKVVLQGDQRARLVPVATTNPEAYALYLQASAIFNRREGSDSRTRSPTSSRPSGSTRPTPARTRASPRCTRSRPPTCRWSPRPRAARPRSTRAGDGADAALAEPHAVLALLFTQQRRYEDEWVAIERALALDPDDVTANFWFASGLITQGYGGRAASGSTGCSPSTRSCPTPCCGGGGLSSTRATSTARSGSPGARRTWASPMPRSASPRRRRPAATGRRRSISWRLPSARGPPFRRLETSSPGVPWATSRRG